MRNDRLIKALEKAGYKVEKAQSRDNAFYCESAKRILSWWNQDSSAICVKTRRHDDHDDMQSDYCVGYFCSTIKRAVASLGE